MNKKMAQPHFDRERAKKNKQRWQTFQIVAILVLGLIAIGLLEKNDFLTRQNTQLKKQAKQSYADGKQNVYQEIKEQGDLIMQGNDRNTLHWEVPADFTDY